MAQVLLMIQTIVAVLGMLPKLIDAIEGMFPAGTAGAVKLAQAKTVIETAVGVEANVAPVFGSIWAVAEPAIAAIVAAKKATNTTAAPATPAVPVA